MDGTNINRHELPKTYDFAANEEKLYRWWEEQGYFKPWNDPNKPDFNPDHTPYVISIPPPNVTGELHLGHAMFVSMEDLMIRYHRMKGMPTLWVPGTDHAGIATQMVVERALNAQGINREDLGREKFIEKVWEWKEKYHDRIVAQIRRLGASCDWDRERFTLDEGLSKAVREVFVRFYEDGLMYRGPRIVNWSPKLQTAVSDLEVEYSEEPGTLYYFKYMLADGSGDYLPVATTRPETILGDTAVAVHPEDERYQKYIGKTALVPIVGREIPIIADEYVDREFGTGVVKITPAHDPNDYKIGETHHLEMINILTKDAKINEAGAPYTGMDRFECRKKIWADMKEAGLVIKEEPYMMNIPRSQRSGEIIEPMISTQWFLKMKPLAEPALEAVRNGSITIIPDRFTKVYYNWLENIQDWCVSRQLWWGHRIPVWYCQDCGEVSASRTDLEVCPKCGSKNIEQDPDVLDTWFSSWLWPFSTLGWPEETPDYQYFYPTTMMETGYDILFFWVARMIMSGLYFTGKIPFSQVYLHGLVRDEHGMKMSKTKGNVVDPLTVMDQFGTDALRFTLLVGSTAGNDTNLSVKKVEANRNFANKLWNAGRFVIGALDKAPSRADDGSPIQPTLADRWIWARLQNLITDVERLFDSHQYGEAGRQIYDFFWSEYADWYLEIAKIQLSRGENIAFNTSRLLVRILDTCLRLLHPFTPYVTEALWGHLKTAAIDQSEAFAPASGWEEALIIAKWPEAELTSDSDQVAVKDMLMIQDVIRAVRNIRTEKNIKPGTLIPATIVTGEKTAVFESQRDVIATLAHLDPEKLEILPHLDTPPADRISTAASGIGIFLQIEEEIDLAAERDRLQKELTETNEQIDRLEKLLNSAFSEKAPAAVVEKEREKLAKYRDTAINLNKQLSNLR
ncbi:MAG TPA: valine--tRNA ligase [Flexilinea sp.]|nr:valine--tRNA ligase [Flexilinea sp.]